MGYQEKDKDIGVGDPTHYPADDLERLYRLGNVSSAPRIRGDALNTMLGVTKYDPEAWYVVTDNKKVRKL